ncbi:MAG: glutamyl-tRNA amidotransferase, partial [Alphaproteobacteria bacterium]|nr:glutamyl-tRNA amidotransferase [Alphaproteobacteria bacterium]
TDAFAFADTETAAMLQPLVARLGKLIGDMREEIMAPAGLAAWYRAQSTLQPHEAGQTFAEWIERANPRLQFSVARNLVLGSQIPPAELTHAALVREEARGRMRQLLQPGTILCLPTTPFPAPRCGQPVSATTALRARIICLCAHGGLTGVPHVTIPGSLVDGRPVGLSIVGARGNDAMLVATAGALLP